MDKYSILVSMREQNFYPIFLIVIISLFSFTNCSILDSRESCNYKDEGVCYNIIDAGSVSSSDLISWCKELGGEHEEEGCSEDGSKDVCVNIKSEDYKQINYNDKNKGNLEELEFYFYKTEIIIPVSSTQRISYHDYNDFCSDIEGEILTEE